MIMRPLAWYQLRDEIEDFLYFEADLLDQRRFKEWLDLLAEDLVYFMPMRRNVKFGQHAERENTRQGEGISWFDGCRFLVYQNRVEYENHTFIGRRTDELRRAGTSWQIARREMLLEQNVLLAKNLSIFF